MTARMDVPQLYFCVYHVRFCAPLSTLCPPPFDTPLMPLFPIVGLIVAHRPDRG